MPAADFRHDLTGIVDQLGHAPVRDLLQHLYRDLHKLAHGLMGPEKAGQSLQTTALLHEAYLRLLQSAQRYESREHLFNTAAAVMRHVLVDNARRKKRLRHGAERDREPLSDVRVKSETNPVEALDIVALEEALELLAVQHPRKARVVGLKFFVGLKEAQTAELLGVDPKTVRRHWSFAKLWLVRQMGGHLTTGTKDRPA